MPYTLNSITPAERARLGDAEAQKIVDEWNAFEATRPQREWLARIAASDILMGPRAVEEILDFAVNGAPISQTVKDALASRKAIRGSKP